MVVEGNGVCMLGSFNSTLASGHLGTGDNHVKWWEEWEKSGNLLFANLLGGKCFCYICGLFKVDDN